MDQRVDNGPQNKFLRNAWYPFAWEEEIGDGPFGRTILSTPIVVFRDAAGALAAIGGRCPHRFAPLRLGKVIEGRLECAYHGLMFDGAGRCVANPHDDIVPKTGVPVYPLQQRYGLIWLWMGEPERADPGLLPSFPSFEDPDFETIHGTIQGEGHYELYSDNIMDLSHAAYLHSGLAAPIFVIGQRRFEQDGDRVWTKISHPNDHVSDFIGAICDVTGRKQDQWVDVRWEPPAAMLLDADLAEPGQPRRTAVPSAHIFSPENETSTFYFWMVGWRRRDIPGFAETMRGGFVHAFENEDKPMILEQSRLMAGEDFWALGPVLLRGDAGGVRARRTLARLIREEQAGTASGVPRNADAEATAAAALSTIGA